MEQRALALEQSLAGGGRFTLYLPAREAWNGRLALVTCDAADAAAGWPNSAAECLALRRRGYACVAPGGVTRLADALAAAPARVQRLLGAAPRQCFVLAHGHVACDALQLAAALPGSVQGIVVGGLVAPGCDPDLRAFAAAGGRLIAFLGLADQAAPSAAAIEWFESLERRAGGAVAAAGFARLFLWPEVGHDMRGQGPGEVDWITHLERWLFGTPPRPPDDPVAVRRIGTARPARSLFAPGMADPEDVAASRPAYPFPLRTVFKGRGDPSHWESWFAPAIYRRPFEALRPDEVPAASSTAPVCAWPATDAGDVAPVAVFGASGRLGAAILEALGAAGVASRPVVRNPQRLVAAGLDASAAAVADVRDAGAVDAALVGARSVIFAASATAGGDGDNTPQAVEYAGFVNVVDAARRHGLRRVLLVSSAACTQREHIHNLWGDILLWKLRAEDYLRQSGVPYTVLRPTGLRQHPGGQRGIHLVQGDRIAFGEEIGREDVASLCVAALGDPGAAGKTFEAYSDATQPCGGLIGSFAALAPD